MKRLSKLSAISRRFLDRGVRQGTETMAQLSRSAAELEAYASEWDLEALEAYARELQQRGQSAFDALLSSDGLASLLGGQMRSSNDAPPPKEDEIVEELSAEVLEAKALSGRRWYRRWPWRWRQRQ